MTGRPTLPRPMQGQDWHEWAERFVAAVEREMAQSPAGRTYTVTNGVTVRTLNVSTAAASDCAQVLGTLIGDLKAKGSVP